LRTLVSVASDPVGAEITDVGTAGEETTAEGGETAMADQPASEENETADDVPHVIAAK
jgi:hypothetical protein